MKNIFLFVLAFATTSSVFAGKVEMGLGVSYLSYTSDFLAHGSEQSAPFSLGYRSTNGRLLINAETSFMMGDYQQDGVDSIGLAAKRYEAKHWSDSKAGATFSLPLGSFVSVLALQFNIPSGEDRWENLQLTNRKTPGNIPVVFVPIRYRGRGLGVNTLLGVGREFSGWEVSLAGGYLKSGGMDVGPGGTAELDLGDYRIGILAVGRKLQNGSRIRLKVSRAYPLETVIDGKPIFLSPTSTSIALRFETRGSNRFGLDVSYSLYGKGEIPNVDGVLTEELYRSLGARLELKPSLQYGGGKLLRFETALRMKYVAPNEYPEDQGRFEGGGTLLGAQQGLRYKIGAGMLFKIDGGFDYILNAKAARDLNYQFTTVTYQVVTVKSGVVYSW